MSSGNCGHCLSCQSQSGLPCINHLFMDLMNQPVVPGDSISAHRASDPPRPYLGYRMRSQSPTRFSQDVENASKRSRRGPRRSRGRRASSSPAQGGNGLPRHPRRAPGSSRPSTTPRTKFLASVQRPTQQFQETLEARRASVTPRTAYHFSEFPSVPKTSPQPSQATLFSHSYNLGRDSRSAPAVSNSRRGAPFAELQGRYERAKRRISEIEASPLYEDLLRDRRTVEDYETMMSYLSASAPADPAGHSIEGQTQSLFNQHLTPRSPSELRLPTFNQQPSTRSMHFGRSSRSSVPSFAPSAADRFRQDHPSRPLSPAEESTASRRRQPVSNRTRGVSERAMQRPAGRHGSLDAHHEGNRPESNPSVRRTASFQNPRYHGVAPPAELSTHSYEHPAPWTSLHRSPSPSDLTTSASMSTSTQQPPEFNFDGLTARFDALNEEYDAIRGPPAPRMPPTSIEPLAHQPYVEDAQQPPEVNFDSLAARLDALHEKYNAHHSPPVPRSSEPLTHQPYVENADNDDETDDLISPD